MLEYWLVRDSLKTITVDQHFLGQPINICFAPTSINELELGLNVITKLTGNSNKKISLVFTNSFLENINSTRTKANFESLLFAYFFSPLYYKINGNPSIFLSESYTEHLYFQKIQTECKLQGYNKLYFFTVRNNETIYLTSDTYDYNTKKIIQKIKICILSWLKNNDWEDEIYPPHIILKHPKGFIDQSEIISLEKILIKHVFQNKLYRGLEALFLEKKEKKMLKQKIKRLKEDNTNLKSYLSSQSTNSIELLNWYEKQYEVLPLWYKRFGHILKVLMGKRTLQSLFKDE